MVVILENDAKASQYTRAGTFERSITVNGKRSWKSKDQAIWFYPKTNNWKVGLLKDIGNNIAGLSSFIGSGGNNPYDLPSNDWNYCSTNTEKKWQPSNGNIIIQCIKGKYVDLIIVSWAK